MIGVTRAFVPAVAGTLVLASCSTASAAEERAFEELISEMTSSAACTGWPKDDPEVIRLRDREEDIEWRSRFLGLHGAFERGAEKANEFLAIAEIDCPDREVARGEHSKLLLDIEQFLAERER